MAKPWKSHPELEVKEPLPKQCFCICMWADKVVLLLSEGKIHTGGTWHHGEKDVFLSL